MRKLLIKIKLYIVEWLFKEQLTIINKDFKKRLQARDDRISYLENSMRMIIGETKVGMDYHEKYDRSWVVICIRGEKKEWVQFFDIHDREIGEIQRIFQKFQKSNITMDLPPNRRRFEFFDK